MALGYSARLHYSIVYGIAVFLVVTTGKYRHTSKEMFGEVISKGNGQQSHKTSAVKHQQASEVKLICSVRSKILRYRASICSGQVSDNGSYQVLMKERVIWLGVLLVE